MKYCMLGCNIDCILDPVTSLYNLWLQGEVVSELGMRELYARIILGILIADGILRKYFILCRKVISHSYTYI